MMQAFLCILLNIPSHVSSELQDLGSLDKPQVIKAMKQGPALRNPVPKPSLVKAPPGLAGKAKPFSQVADTARDLHTSRQVHTLSLPHYSSLQLVEPAIVDTLSELCSRVPASS